MKNLLVLFVSIWIIVSSCNNSESRIATKYGISDSTAKALLKISLPVDFSYLKSHEREIVSALDYFQELNDAFAYAYCCRLYGVLLSNSGEYNKAQVYYLKAYDIFEKQGRQLDKAKLCNDMGRNYAEIKSLGLAYKYYDISLKIGKQLNDSLIQAYVMQNLGNTYRKRNPDSSIMYYQQALAILPNRSAENVRAKIRYNMANVFFDRKEFSKAKVVYEELLNEGLKKKKFEMASVNYNALAAIYLAEKKNDLSLDYQKAAIKIADSLKEKNLLLKFKSEIVKHYEFTKDFKNAFIESKNLKILSDSIFAKEKQIAVHELDVKYQTEKKENENRQLKTESNLKLVAITFLIFISGILFFLFRSRSNLVKEKSIAYDVLMEKYRLEKKEREKQSGMLESISKSNSQTSTGEMSIMDKILDYYKERKPYLNPKLKVDDVARHLKVSHKEIAAAIKNYDNSNCNAFTNKLRVEEARRKFEDPSFDMYKMEVISEQSGFGTIQSFYNAFELYTGVKPAYYRMQMKSF